MVEYLREAAAAAVTYDVHYGELMEIREASERCHKKRRLTI